MESRTIIPVILPVRRDPFETMERTFEQMRRSGIWGETMSRVQGGSAFDTNVSPEREDDAFVVMADLPGFEREEIEVTYVDRTLPVSGVHEDGDGDAHRSWSVQETVTIPDDVNVEAIDATDKNGVLAVRLPSTIRTPLATG